MQSKQTMLRKSLRQTEMLCIWLIKFLKIKKKELVNKKKDRHHSLAPPNTHGSSKVKLAKNLLSWYFVSHSQ